ncbi:hypothetical protein BC827DRAFT_1153843 [Russula dissimulans]|nr:hypothetical protein BC827DRAFT_1153843 [Russula dissimulans]
MIGSAYSNVTKYITIDVAQSRSVMTIETTFMFRLGLSSSTKKCRTLATIVVVVTGHRDASPDCESRGQGLTQDGDGRWDELEGDRQDSYLVSDGWACTASGEGKGSGIGEIGMDRREVNREEWVFDVLAFRLTQAIVGEDGFVGGGEGVVARE